MVCHRGIKVANSAVMSGNFCTPASPFFNSEEHYTKEHIPSILRPEQKLKNFKNLWLNSPASINPDFLKLDLEKPGK